MRNPLKSDQSTSLGLFLARLPMGLFFVLAGYAKLHGGVNDFVETYQSYIPQWAPPEMGMRYLQLVPYLEVAVGAMLVLGLLTRLAAFVGALMVISYTLAITGVHAKDLPFHPNLIYLGLLLSLLFAGPGKLSLDGVLFTTRPRPVRPD